MTLEEAYVITQEDMAKEVRPTPAFRGYLYLGDPHKSEHVLGIPVFMFLRTKAISLPIGHKYSAYSNGPTHKIEPNTMYKVNSDANTGPSSFSLDDVDEKVIEDKSRLEQAFRFGKTAILISRDEVISNKFTSKKELTVIGFIDKKDVNMCRMGSCLTLDSRLFQIVQASLLVFQCLYSDSWNHPFV